MSGKKYGFVGLDRTTGDITTFHIKNISELIKKAEYLLGLVDECSHNFMEKPPPAAPITPPPPLYI